jgi:hypothetical protein
MRIALFIVFIKIMTHGAQEFAFREFFFFVSDFMADYAIRIALMGIPKTGI